MPVKITLEEVLNSLKSKKYELLNIDEFKNTNSIGQFKCLTHNTEWKCGIRYTLKDIQYCKECKQTKEKLTLNEILMKNGFKLNKKMKNEYGEFECLYGHIWNTKMTNISLQISGCKECYRPKITLEMIKNKIKEKNYILLNEDQYKNTKQKIKFQCIFGHIWITEGYNVYSEKSGCPECSIGNCEMICIFVMNHLFNAKFYKTRAILPSKLELDGYNDDLRLAVEYNGIQHYQEFKKHFHKIGSLEDQKRRDITKMEECIKLDITLIVVPYNYNTFNLIKDYIISELNKYEKYKKSYDNTLNWTELKQLFYKEFEILKENPDEFTELLDIIIKKEGKCISEKYINTKHKLKIKCKNDLHPIFEMNSTDLKRNRWCKLCAHNSPMSKDRINEIIKETKIIMLDEYIKSNTSYKFQCEYGHIFNSSWDNMKQRFKKGCRICKNKKD